MRGPLLRAVRPESSFNPWLKLFRHLNAYIDTDQPELVRRSREDSCSSHRVIESSTFWAKTNNWDSACLSNWACASSEFPRSVNLIYRYKLLFEQRLQTVPIVACVLPLSLCLVYTTFGIGDGGLCCVDTPIKFSLARPMRCFSIRQSRTGKYKAMIFAVYAT
jgi:hypothetical protein